MSPAKTPEEERIVAQVVALRPVWEEGPCRAALQAFLEEVCATEKAVIDETLENCGFKLSIDPAACRKVEYNATRKAAFEDLLALIDSRVTEAESITGVRVLAKERQ